MKALRIGAYVLAVVLAVVVGRVVVPIDVTVTEIVAPSRPGQPRMMGLPVKTYEIPVIGRLDGSWVPIVVLGVSILVFLLLIFVPGLIWRRSFIAGAFGRLLISVLLVGLAVLANQ